MDRANHIYIIIPAFNESQRINHVIRDVGKYADKIIVIDDGSSDDTLKKISGKNTVVLRHLLNLGQGAALQTGFTYVVQQKANIAVTYDADGQFYAEDIPKIIQPLLDNKADVSLGSRFLGKTIGMPLLKLLTLKLGVLFTWLFSEIKLTDAHNGFRALNKKALLEINISQNRMAHASEIIEQIKIKKLRFVEVPVTIKYDEYSKKKGQSPLNSFNILFNLIFKKLF